MTTTATPPLAPDIAAGLRRAQALHDPPARPRVPRHRQDPTLGTRRTAPHPHRPRDHLTRPIERPNPDHRRTVPGHQDARRVRPLRIVDPRPQLRLPRLTRVDRAPRRTCASSAPPAPATDMSSSPSESTPSTPAAGSVTSPPLTSSSTSTVPSPTTPSAASSSSLLRNDLIIVDEVGFVPLDHNGAQLLFRIVSAAYERRAVPRAWPAIGPSTNWAGSCPSTPPRSASWTACSTMQMSSSPTATPTACVKPEPKEEPP